MEEAQDAHNKRVAEIESDYKKLEVNLRQQLRVEMDDLIKEQMKEMQEMQNDFQQASELMDQKYRQLSERFTELQDLYENRPSRPEDLEMIRQLQEEIIQKDNLLKKAAEDMKFYKLELINREKSYNEMFGVKDPTVGLINPTQKVGPQMGVGGQGKMPAGPMMMMGGTGIQGTGAKENGMPPVPGKPGKMQSNPNVTQTRGVARKDSRMTGM